MHLTLLLWLVGATWVAAAPKTTNILNLVALDLRGFQEIKLLLQQLDSKGLASVSKKLDPGSVPIDGIMVACVGSDHEVLGKCSEGVGAGVEMKRYQVTPLMDYTVARKKRRVEKVSSIMEVLKGEYARHLSEISGSSSNNRLMVTLVFDEQTKPTVGPMFRSIFEKFDALKADVILPGKNKGLTSVSDWHDFVVTGMRVSSQSSAGRFLDSFVEIYRHHSSASGRKAFTLLEPRPATRESMMRIAYGARPWEGQQQSMTREDREGRAGFHYFQFEEICGGDGREVSAQQPIPCLNNEMTFLTMGCGHSGDSLADKTVCQTIDEPPTWRHVERHMPSSWAERVRKPPDVLESNPIVGMWMGVDRFRPATGGRSQQKQEPRKFCWESDQQQPESMSASRKADAWVEYNVTHAWKYQHPPEETLHAGLSRSKVLMLTASEASASSLDRYLHLQLSKMYYCHRHGYRFMHLLSHAYTDYFHPQHFENAPGGIGSRDDRYFRGVMSKVVMLAEAMLTHMDSEWVLWTDEDLYLNPGWMHLRLEKYLEGVPPHKLYVAANYRTTFTNIFFVRNSPEGRALVFDWLAVAMSGYVECHGYDQAAVATLHLARTLETYRQQANPGPGNGTSSSTSASGLREYAYQNSKPFGHQCLHCEGEDKCGCNTKGDWSCDFKFEASAQRAGYGSEPQPYFHGGIISSFTKGCANEAWPDFHIVTESSDRPRLQCGLCTRLNEIESSGHWDGPLGGGNDKLRPGTINGWLFNHKSQFLFYEAYLDPDACKAVPEDKWVPTCRRTTAASDRDKKRDTRKSKFEKIRSQEHVVSLADGYGYDVEESTFCRFTDTVQLNEQRTKTYMKEYPELMQRMAGYTASEWEALYQHWDGGEGRTPCGNKIKEMKTDAPERNPCEPWGAHSQDNQRLRRPQRSTLWKVAPELMGGTMSNPESDIETDAEIVREFQEKQRQLNKVLFEAPDVCSSPHCEEVEMDWGPYAKPDPWMADDKTDEVDLSYRKMNTPANAQATSQGNFPLVKGKVVQCSE